MRRRLLADLRGGRPRLLRRAPRSPAAEDYARARLPGSRIAWRAAGWCALDFELTGLDRRTDEIISFGAIPIEDGRVRLRDAVSGLARATRESSDAAIRVHGIRSADLADAPPLAQSIETLLPALSGRILVAHTAVIERSFLTRALSEHGLRVRGPVVDVEVLGRLWLFKRDRSFREHIGLAELAAELGLPAERPHVALGDALTTAQVFIALAAHLDAAHAETVGSLTRAQRRLDAMRYFHG